MGDRSRPATILQHRSSRSIPRQNNPQASNGTHRRPPARVNIR
nr:MAG TPA: hypothetical protein [Caudoviricetes sp.]